MLRKNRSKQQVYSFYAPAMTESIDDILQTLKTTFVSGLPSKINEIESQVLALERSSDTLAHYLSLYRYVHSLKGSGGTHGFHILSTVCHQFEDVLSIHGREKPFTSIAIDLLLSYVDILKNTYALITKGETNFAEIEQRLADLKVKFAPNQAQILLVDSSRTVPAICKEALSKYNAQVVICDDGLTALQRLMHEKFDMLITSKELKTLDGLALISAVHMGSRINKGIRIVLMTSNKSMSVDNPLYRVIFRDANLLSSLCATFEELLPQYVN